MKSSRPGRSSRDVNAARPNGTIDAGALNLKDVTARTCRQRSVSHCGQTIAVNHIEAHYDPSGDALAGLPDGARQVKTVRHRPILLATNGTVPQQVVFTGPLLEIPRADGSCWYWAPLPQGIDAALGVSETLKVEIRRLLAHHSIRAVRQMTLAPRRVVEALAQALRDAEGAAMIADGARPAYLALDGLDLKQSAGKDRPVAHLVASDPARGLHWTLALIDWQDGEEVVVERVVAAIAKLPFPEAVLAIATDYGDVERRIAATAVARIQASRPGFQPKAVIDRFHVQGCFRDAMEKFRVRCWKQFRYGKNGRKLKNVSKADLEKIDNIKGAANALAKMRRAKIEQNLKAQIRLEKACAAEPALASAYDLLEALRQIFDCRRLADAEARYAAWCAAYAASGLDCFDGPANNLACEWPNLRSYFEVLESFDRTSNQDLKIGSNACESLNRQAREIWRQGRSASVARLEQRLLARQGYRVKAARCAEPDLPARRRRQKND